MSLSYLERQHVIQQLGFSNYKEYLQSDLWKIIRKHILARDAYHCRARRCNNRTNEVHHFTYDSATLIGRSPYTLVSLCRECHYSIEFDGDKKRPLKEVQIKTLEKVLDTSIIKGVSNPKIGKWFRNQIQMNIKIRDSIRAELKGISLLH